MRTPYLFSIILLFYFLFAQGCMRMRTNDSKAKKEFYEKGIPFYTKNSLIDGLPFHYATNGLDTQTTLIFIHGSPGSWDAYKGFLKDSSLYANFRLIAIDRPGFGYSEFGKPFNLIYQSEILAKFIKSIKNGKPVYLIGHSYGGPLVLQMATDTTLEIEGLLVLAGSVSPYLEKPENWRLPFIWMPYLAPGALRVSNIELWWLKQDLYLLEKNLGNIKAKVSVVHGSIDRLVPYENMQFTYKNLINAKSIDTLTIVGADHFIPWSHYLEVKNALHMLIRH